MTKSRAGSAARSAKQGKSSGLQEGGGTRQRLVGAIVLLVIAGLLLPLIFDGQGAYQEPLERRITTPPPIPQVPGITARRPEITADSEAIRLPASSAAPSSRPSSPSPASPSRGADGSAETDDPAEASTPSQAEASASDSPRLDSQGLPESWSVRLAAFSSEDNASRLMQRLQDSGYRAYLRRMTSSQGELSVVYVGPKVERREIERLQLELEEEFELSGMIVRFEVEEL